MLFANGVFLESGEFKMLPAPRNEDIEQMVVTLKTRVLRSLTKKGYINGYDLNHEEDQLMAQSPLFAEGMSCSVTRTIAWGERRGQKIERIGQFQQTQWAPPKGTRCSYLDGFSLHANVAIGAQDREGLEHLCRYINRPAIANHRLSKDNQGNIIYQLKRSYGDGTTHLRFTPEQFIEKLIALVPPPRANLARYHGVFAPNASLRSKVVIKKKTAAEKTKKKTSYRLLWARLLKRVFTIEVSKCQCGGTLKLISPIFDTKAIIGILQSLKIECKLPQFAPARAPPQADFFRDIAV